MSMGMDDSPEGDARRRAFEENNLTFAKLSRINRARSRQWMRGKTWSLGEWMNALVGEVGECANYIKKISRIDLGLTGNTKVEDVDRERLVAEARKELADIQLYLDLLAEQLAPDIPFESIIKDKFNEASKKLGFEERL